MTERSPIIASLLEPIEAPASIGARREVVAVSDAAVESRIAYGDLAQRALERCAALRALDLREGDLVMLAYPASIDFVAMFMGCVLAGVLPCAMPMPGKRMVDTTNSVIDVACALYRPRAIFTTDDCVPPLEAIAAARGVRLIGHSQLAAAAASGARPVVSQRAPGDPHHVQLTSGSVSNPKAAVISHHNVWSNVDGIVTAMNAHADTARTVLWLPLYHDMGLITLLTATHHKSALMLMQPTSFIRNPLGWLKRMAAFEATITVAPTFALRYCLRRFNEARMRGVDLRSLRNFLIGAEHVDEDTLHEFVRTFAPYGFSGRALQPCYGMAESTLAVTMQQVTALAPADAERALPFVRADQRDGTIRLSMGTPITGMQAEVRDATGRTLGEREVGEIMIRGSSVMLGYLAPAREAGVAAPAVAAVRDDGWLATGDLGYVADGQFFILGRMKEILIIRGVNHFPEEIEAAVADHAAISKDGCAAIGVRDEAQGTEQLVLLIETAPENVTATARAELQALLQQHVGFAAADLRFVAPGALPRTTSGKLQRLKCRQLFLDGAFAEALPDSASEAPAA
ncbi:MAG TPA: AMP-binding protein [Kofleriaceae bacterium]|nr:AMP-binding protein [Kofleriaceae bacterium]